MKSDTSEIIHFNSIDYFYIGTLGSLKDDCLHEFEILTQMIENQYSGKHFIFDYYNLEFCSSHGLIVILKLHQLARNKGKVYILPPQNDFRQIMLDIGILKESEIYVSMEIISELLHGKNKSLFTFGV